MRRPVLFAVFALLASVAVMAQTTSIHVPRGQRSGDSEFTMPSPVTAANVAGGNTSVILLPDMTNATMDSANTKFKLWVYASSDGGNTFPDQAVCQYGFTGPREPGTTPQGSCNGAAPALVGKVLRIRLSVAPEAGSIGLGGDVILGPPQ